MARSASAAITTSAKDNPADDFYSSLIDAIRRSHRLAPCVRQTGERKAQTCAKGILRQHRLLSACSKRARIGTHRPLPQHTSDDNAFYHSGGDHRKATRPLAAIETSVVPGEFFEQPQHFRIGFGGATETVRAGLERLCAALEAFHQPSR